MMRNAVLLSSEVVRRSIYFGKLRVFRWVRAVLSKGNCRSENHLKCVQNWMYFLVPIGRTKCLGSFCRVVPPAYRRFHFVSPFMRYRKSYNRSNGFSVSFCTSFLVVSRVLMQCSRCTYSVFSHKRERGR